MTVLENIATCIIVIKASSAIFAEFLGESILCIIISVIIGPTLPIISITVHFATKRTIMTK